VGQRRVDVGYNGRNARKQWDPANISGDGHQDFARQKLTAFYRVHLADIDKTPQTHEAAVTVLLEKR